MILLVIGGSGSGKSAFAEARTAAFPADKKYYIATMQAFDDEALAKIERHRKMRAHKGFETIECQRNLAGAGVSQGSDVLLECISNLVANEMFRDGEIKTTGTDIDSIMPPVSRFGSGNRAQKKQTIIDKLKTYFERFFGIG